jgi:hypothetical protein
MSSGTKLLPRREEAQIETVSLFIFRNSGESSMIPPALGHGPIRYAEPSPASGPHCQFSLVKGPAVARRRASLISSIVFDIVFRLSMVNPGAAINMTSPKKLIKLILSHAGWESSVKSAMAGEAYTSQLSFRDPDLWGFRESAGPKLLRPEAVVSQTIHQDIKLSVTKRERIHHWIFRSALEASSETPLMILSAPFLPSCCCTKPAPPASPPQIRTLGSVMQFLHFGRTSSHNLQRNNHAPTNIQLVPRATGVMQRRPPASIIPARSDITSDPPLGYQLPWKAYRRHTQ